MGDFLLIKVDNLSPVGMGGQIILILTGNHTGVAAGTAVEVQHKRSLHLGHPLNLHRCIMKGSAKGHVGFPALG